MADRVHVRVRREERRQVDVRRADEHHRTVAPVRRHTAEEPQVDALVEQADDDDRRRAEAGRGGGGGGSGGAAGGWGGGGRPGGGGGGGRGGGGRPPAAPARSFARMRRRSRPLAVGRRMPIELTQSTRFRRASRRITWLLLVGWSSQSFAKQTMSAPVIAALRRRPRPGARTRPRRSVRHLSSTTCVVYCVQMIVSVPGARARLPM